MPDLDADTHGQLVTGTGGTAAGDTTIGSITLPAGDEWTIFGFWCQAVSATATAGEGLTGHARFQAAQGDLEPNPAPVRFPIPGVPSFLGAVGDIVRVPLKIWPINYKAPGKATIDFILNKDTAVTVAPQVAMGILFGKTVPVATPLLYADRVTVAVTSATESQIGTITLAEKAKMIRGICGSLVQDNVLTTAEELIGFFRLDSPDIKMTPAQYPFGSAYCAGLGATIAQTGADEPIMIPTNIPAVGGARIDCFVDLNSAVTNAAQATVTLFYE